MHVLCTCHTSELQLMRLAPSYCQWNSTWLEPYILKMNILVNKVNYVNNNVFMIISL